jgi:hypothetical protein
MSGLVGMIVFLVLHALWIMPIWFIAPIGALISVGGGIVTGQCYARASKLSVWRPISSLYVFLMVGVTLLPCVLLIKVVPPLLESQNGEVVHPINMPWIVSGFFLLLIIPAAGVGWIFGRILGGDRSSAAIFSVMGLLIALGPGHNLPLFGAASGEQLTMALTLTFAPIAAAAVVLAEGAALWALIDRKRRAAVQLST